MRKPLFILICLVLVFSGCKHEVKKHIDTYDSPDDIVFTSIEQIGGYKVLKSFFIPSTYGYSEKYHLKLERVSDGKRQFIEVSEKLFLDVDEGKIYPVVVEKEEEKN